MMTSVRPVVDSWVLYFANFVAWAVRGLCSLHVLAETRLKMHVAVKDGAPHPVLILARLHSLVLVLQVFIPRASCFPVQKLKIFSHHPEPRVKIGHLHFLPLHEVSESNISSLSLWDSGSGTACSGGHCWENTGTHCQDLVWQKIKANIMHIQECTP